MLFARVNRKEKEIVRLIAKQRGESEAQTIRAMIARESKIVLKGQADAPLPHTRLEMEQAFAFTRELCRAAKRQRKR